MSNLNVSEWHEFIFHRIFRIENGFYNKKPEHDTAQSNEIPFIGASDKNHGITGYFTLEEIKSASRTGNGKNEDISKKIYPAHAVCVTNDGSVGYAYYMNKSFTCSHSINPLYRIDGDFNKYTGLFIATVIMKDRYRWGYGRKWRPNRMKNSVIKLPVLTNTKGLPILDPKCKFSDDGYIPDWEFMEKYIKSLKHEKTITKNKSAIDLNTKKWKYFLFSDLNITIYKSIAHVKIDSNISDMSNPNSIPFVSRTQYNNAVDEWVIPEKNDQIEKGNAITIGDTTATINYQEKPFITGDHIIVIRANWINKYTALFIKTILDQEKYRYSYGRAFTKDLVENTKLILPVNDFNEPDYDFMENYIKSLPNGDLI